jgi:hypothetical protein
MCPLVITISWVCNIHQVKKKTNLVTFQIPFTWKTPYKISKTICFNTNINEKMTF